MRKRIVSLILALFMVVSMAVVPVSASYTYSRDTASKAQLDNLFSYGVVNDSALYNLVREYLFPGVSAIRSDVDWALFNIVLTRIRNLGAGYAYGEVSKENLDNICYLLNNNFVQFNGSLLDLYIKEFVHPTQILNGNSFRTNVWYWLGVRSNLKFDVTFDVSDGIYRINMSCNTLNYTAWSGYLTDKNGDFWYAPDDDPVESYAADNAHAKSGLVWVTRDNMQTILKVGKLSVCNEYEFDGYIEAAKTISQNSLAFKTSIGDGTYFGITDGSAKFLAYRYYDSDGSITLDTLIVKPQNENNFYTGNDQTVTENTENATVDLNLGDLLILDAINKYTLNQNGDLMFIDDVIFDQSTKTYQFNTTTNNEYNYYDNRSWSYSWTYHINYTSITYIGQSEEYDEYYEFYYQLPDGRSSADLTAEELEQLNLSVDVINYGRSADDTRLRSLYHFDGNTDDASYWNYCTAFTWNTGASLTYMESGNFNGALYLDETAHDFTLTLPSSIGSNDFTFQFRIYQSYTAAPQDDSYIRFGSTDLMRFNGSQILNGSGTVLSSMPIGTWNELAIIRESGTVRYYLNGVQLGTVSNTTAFTAAVTFHFGSTQQTYKELDELRVLNYALTEGGASYTPTSVPHDTNLALVLPDSVVPVADEYWDIHNDSQTNLLSQYNLDWWDISHSESGVYSSYFDNRSFTSYSSVPISNNVNYSNFRIVSPEYSFTSGVFSFDILNYSLLDCTVFSTSDFGTSYFAGSVRYKPPSNDLLYFPLRFNALNFQYLGLAHSSQGFNVTQNHTFSIVFSDGSILSVPASHSYNVSFSYNIIRYYQNWLEYSDDRCMVYSYITGTNDFSAMGFFVVPLQPLEVLYTEVVEGDHSDLTAEFVSSVTLMDSASLNTPTLAVRSDIPVTNYLIGGVRPSIPSKGLVWAMVESGYITSLQIYDGRAWVQCDGRIWTGERWIPYSSYNVVTLSDMYDISDASGQTGYEYIYTESGFWSWFQKAWLDFRQWTSTLLSTVQGLGSGGGGDSITNISNTYDIDISSERDSATSGLFGFIQIIRGLFTDDREDSERESISTAFTSDSSERDGVFYIWLNPENLMIGEGG